MKDVLAGLEASAVGPRVLVTGGAGYFGTHLRRVLEALGCQVRSFDLKPTTGDCRMGDLLDPSTLAAACEGIDTVFHTATLMALWGYAWRSERDAVHAVNVAGTNNVIAACQRAGVRRLVHISSSNVVFDYRSGFEGGDESSPYASRFVDIYTPAKIAGEQAVLAANTSDLHTVALRPNGLWGPDGEAYMMRSFLTQLASGTFTVTAGDLSTRLDNTHIDNLARACLLAATALAERPDVVSGRPYFVTDGEAVNAMSWFRPLTEALGYTWPTRNVPAWVIYPVSALFEATHLFTGGDPVMTRTKAAKLRVSHWSSIEAARRDLGYEPIRGQADLTADVTPYREALEGLRKRR